MKKWMKLLLVLCIMFSMTIAVHAEETSNENTTETTLEIEQTEENEETDEPEEPAMLATPQVSITQTTQGVALTWNAVEGATKYEVYRSEEKDTWGEKAYFSSSTCRYINTTLEYGATYYYKVKAINEETGQESEFSSVKSRTVKVPKIVELKVDRYSHSAVKLTWEKCRPATGYEIYRATSKNGTYKKVKTVSKRTTVSCQDTGLTIGKTYYYKVRAVYNTKKGTFSDVVSRTVALVPPVMEEQSTVTATSIKVSWEKSPYAQGYYVYRKVPGGSWKQIAKVSGASTVNYTDKNAKAEYQYSVRSYRKVNGKTHKSNRSYSIYASVLETPTFKVSQVSGKKAVKVSWDKVKKATGYKVYERIGSAGEWKCIETAKPDTLSCITSIPTEKTVYWKIRPIYEKDSYCSYGPYTGTKSQRIYLPKFITYLDMKYSAAPSNDNAESILLGVVNIGKGSMRIYSEDAYYNGGTDYDRNLYLADVDTGVTKSYIDVAINSGEITEEDIALPWFIVDGEPTFFDENSELQFIFRYDGLYYRAFVSHKDVDFEEIEKP